MPYTNPAVEQFIDTCVLVKENYNKLREASDAGGNDFSKNTLPSSGSIFISDKTKAVNSCLLMNVKTKSEYSKSFLNETMDENPLDEVIEVFISLVKNKKSWAFTETERKLENELRFMCKFSLLTENELTIPETHPDGFPFSVGEVGSTKNYLRLEN